jgi:hypothetical protein
MRGLLKSFFRAREAFPGPKLNPWNPQTSNAQSLPDSFYELEKLSELTLVNNQLEEVPAKLAGIGTLKELYLNGACGRKPVVVPEEVKKRGVLQDCYEGQIWSRLWFPRSVFWDQYEG